MFTLSSKPLEQINLRENFANPQAGGFACFEGWVRDHNEGKNVVALEYECCEPLAVNEAQAIFKETREKFDVLAVKCVHRSGKLKVGEMSVWIGVSAVHRDAAVKACRYVIDQIKTRLPIWKKEYYTDGDSGWVNCPECEKHISSSSLREKEYYSKQVSLPEVNETGQLKLKESKTLVVGAGGLGSPALMYLAAAGVGTLGICDADNLETSNLHRQTLYSHEHVGQLKAELSAKRIASLNPFIRIKTHQVRLTADNIDSIAAGYDILIDCTDNFETKFLLNDYCVLNKKLLVQASIYQFDGQVRVYDPRIRSSCLRCLWPEIPEPGCVGRCTDVGVLGVVPGILGSLQALEAIKLILHLPGGLKDETLVFDLTNYTVMKLKQTPNSACPLCGLDPKITSIDTGLYVRQSDDLEIDLLNLPFEKINQYHFIDIRESFELLIDPVKLENSRHIPMSQFLRSKPELDRDKKYLLFCAEGVRSYHLASQLREEGFINVYSLNNGTRAIKAYFNAANRGT